MIVFRKKCSYANKYKAIRKPSCGCEYCNNLWLSKRKDKMTEEIRQSDLSMEESKGIILDFFANETQGLKLTSASHAFSDRYPDLNLPDKLTNMQIIFEGGLYSKKANRIMEAILVVSGSTLQSKASK